MFQSSGTTGVGNVGCYISGYHDDVARHRCRKESNNLMEVVRILDIREERFH
jgi:hypothetical protein